MLGPDLALAQRGEDITVLSADPNFHNNPRLVALNELIQMTRSAVTIQSNAITIHSYDNNCKMVGNKNIKSIHYFKAVI